MARIVTYLGVFILLQVITYYLTQENILDSLLAKEVAVGWGVTNNIGLILLFTFPFSFLFGNNKQGYKNKSLYVSFFLPDDNNRIYLFAWFDYSNDFRTYLFTTR